MIFCCVGMCCVVLYYIVSCRIRSVGTFYGATSFTGDGVSNWDTSSVTTLELTFYNATSFMGDGISNWDTSNVKDLKGTFADVISFNGNLSRWNTTSAINMYGAFAGTWYHTTAQENHSKVNALRQTQLLTKMFEYRYKFIDGRDYRELGRIKCD